MKDPARRLVALTLLTGAPLFLATRFHRGVPTTAVVAEPYRPVFPSTTLVTTTTTSTTLPSLTTTAPTTTVPVAVAPEEPTGVEVFEGSRVYTNWGWVKVELTVSDGVMVDIEMLMIPRATKRSEALTAEHEPTLREAALATQSPDVPLITGATNISYGYRVSLIGAMKAAGLWPPPEA